MNEGARALVAALGRVGGKAKRADYFASGTAAVWDVDVRRDARIAVYRAAAPDRPTLYRRGEVAEAEPGLPGWTFPVDRLLE